MLVNIKCHTEWMTLDWYFKLSKVVPGKTFGWICSSYPNPQTYPWKCWAMQVLSVLCAEIMWYHSAYEKGHRASCKQFLIQLQLAFQESWLQNSLFVSWHTVFFEVTFFSCSLKPQIPSMPQVTNIRIIPSILHFYHYPNSFRIRVLYFL